MLGPNGAGKSTHVGMLTTTIVPTGGTARVAGHDVARQPLLARSVSSVVFQEPVVDAALPAGPTSSCTRGCGASRGRGPSAGSQELTGVLGLAELVGRPVDSYSGGQRRRLEIARALISEPQVLFLDEPTVGLDPRIRHELLDVIAGLRAREDLTILITTHYLEEAERLCDRVAIVHDGAVVALDRPRSLLAGLGEEILEFRVHGDGPRRARRACGRAGSPARTRSPSARADRAAARPPGRRCAGGAVEAERLRASEISTRAPTLDDVYLQLTGDRTTEAAGQASDDHDRKEH